MSIVFGNDKESAGPGCRAWGGGQQIGDQKGQLGLGLGLVEPGLLACRGIGALFGDPPRGAVISSVFPKITWIVTEEAEP